MYLESKEGIVCCSNGVCVRLPSGLRDSADSALPGRAAQRLHGPLLVQPQRASALQPPQEHAVASPAAARVTDVALCTLSTHPHPPPPLPLSLPLPISFSSIHFQNKIRKPQIITNVNCTLKVKQNTTGLARHSSNIHSNLKRKTCQASHDKSLKE